MRLRKSGKLAVGRPADLGDGRYDTDRIAVCNRAYPLPDRLDNARRLEAEPYRQRALLDVVVGAEHRFGAVQPKRFHPDLHLAEAGWRNVNIGDLQNVWPTVLIDANDSRHRLHSKIIE